MQIKNLFISSNRKKIQDEKYKLNENSDNLKKVDSIIEEYQHNEELKFEEKYGHKYNPNEVITDEIIDIYTTDKTYEEFGDFLTFDDHKTAEYIFYAVTKNDKYPLMGITGYFDKRYLERLYFNILPDYCYNLSNQQLEHILDLIEQKIFIDGKLNYNARSRNIDQFRADITMIELLGHYLDNQEKSVIIENWLNKIKHSLSTSFSDSSSEKDVVKFFINEDASDEFRFLPMAPFSCYIISDDVKITNAIKEEWEERKYDLLNHCKHK